jgi:hypothetical protein
VQFLYPIGFLALAGLIVPLLIHLWNVKEQKTLKIGSIALLGQTAQVNSKSFKITDWWLLILRCLLLMLIAFLLAQPYIQQKITAKAQGGWICIEKAKFAQLVKSNRKTIDSLLAKHYEIHDFNVGFEQLSLNDTATSTSSNLTANLNYSGLLAQLNDLIPAGIPVYLYANRRLLDFGETLPKLNYDLHWQSIDEKDAVSTWITVFSGKKFEAKSDAFSTTYQVVGSNLPPAIAVGIYENQKSTDRSYLKAALAAIASFTKRKIEINPQNKNYDLAFWLSDEPVTESFKKLIKPEGRLFSYAAGKIVSEPTALTIDDHSEASLYKRIAVQSELPQLWSDGYGHPILTTEKSNGQTIYHFYSRFNPQWGDLVWNDAFVKALLPIVIQDQKIAAFGFETNANDQRLLSTTQAAYHQVPTTAKVGLPIKSQAISIYFWSMALLIFVVERILSFSKKRAHVN